MGLFSDEMHLDTFRRHTDTRRHRSKLNRIEPDLQGLDRSEAALGNHLNVGYPGCCLRWRGGCLDVCRRVTLCGWLLLDISSVRHLTRLLLCRPLISFQKAGEIVRSVFGLIVAGSLRCVLIDCLIRFGAGRQDCCSLRRHCFRRALLQIGLQLAPLPLDLFRIDVFN